MAVDNLPGELPRDASEDFGDDLLAHVLPQFFNADTGTVLQRATETDSGQLTPSFTIYKTMLTMRIRSIVFFFFLATQLWSAPGDTTQIRVHDDVDMTWYVRYREKALFPTQGTDFHRVNMVFTLGCASSGCSDWDYTVLIKVLHPPEKWTAPTPWIH